MSRSKRVKPVNRKADIPVRIFHEQECSCYVWWTFLSTYFARTGMSVLRKADIPVRLSLNVEMIHCTTTKRLSAIFSNGNVLAVGSAAASRVAAFFWQSFK